MNLEEFINKVANSNNINETIENLSKSIVLKYPSFNPNAIPSDYIERQKEQKRSEKEYEVDIEQLKRLLTAYKTGRRFENLYNQAIRVVAGNPDIFTNVVNFAKEAYGIKVIKKEEKAEEKPEEKPVQKTREIRARTEENFLKEVDLILKDRKLERQKSESNIKFLNKFKFSFRKVLEEIQAELKSGIKSKDEIIDNVFNKFHDILISVVKDENIHFDKRDIRLKLPNNEYHDFEVKSNNSKSKNTILKYTQQFRISRSSSIKNIIEDKKKIVIDIYNEVIEKMLDSDDLASFTNKLNRDKNDLLTRINKKIVVINKNDYDLIPVIAKSETVGNYILYVIPLKNVTKYKTIEEWIDDL